MKVLVFNCGSSTLKFSLFDILLRHTVTESIYPIVSGMIENIGTQGKITLNLQKGNKVTEPIYTKGHGEAAGLIIKRLTSYDLINPVKSDNTEQENVHKNTLYAVGHRIVHGGGWFTAPALLNTEAVEKIKSYTGLAPLHNKPALEAICATTQILGDSIPQVAVFDTSFHSMMPEWASSYPLPFGLTEKYRIRRYGFHGLAHQYMLERYAKITGKQIKEANIITLQLGNGCSATAIKGGKSIDTSMGFTPLEGLIMGTRSGNIDPSLPGFLLRHEGIGYETLEELLNKHSGLLGLSGLSGDMRILLDADSKGNKRAKLAIRMFCYRIQKYIGAYMAAIGGAEAIIFGGGIGEHSPVIREMICSALTWCGLYLDSEKNYATTTTEGRISNDDSRIGVYVMPVDESIIIVKETLRRLNPQTTIQ